MDLNKHKHIGAKAWLQGMLEFLSMETQAGRNLDNSMLTNMAEMGQGRWGLPQFLKTSWKMNGGGLSADLYHFSWHYCDPNSSEAHGCLIEARNGKDSICM